MDVHWVPVVLFVCITYGVTFSVKTVVDGRMRKALTQQGVSEDLLRSIVASEEQHRRYSALRWGVVLVALAVGFGLVQSMHNGREWDDITPGVIAILAGAVGLGQLVYFWIAQKVR